MKKLFLSLVLTFVLVFMISDVSALEIAKSGDNVTVEGDYSQLRLIAGNKVNNKSTNDGLSVMAANDLLLEGESTYGFYAGRNITVRETILKDLFIAGNAITFDKASIGRDLYAAGRTIELRATIGRNINIAADVVDLSNAKIKNDAYIDANKIILNENTQIDGVLNYSSSSIVEGLDNAVIHDVKTHVEKDIKTVSTYESISSSIISFIGQFVLLVIILLLIPTFKEELDVEDLATSNILKNVGVGFTLLILIPILCVFGIITVILIPVSIITLILYFIAIYLSFLFVSYVIGNLITTKLFQKDNMYLKAFVGLLIGKAVAMIPVVGGIVVFIMILFGIGHYIKLFKK